MPMKPIIDPLLEDETTKKRSQDDGHWTLLQARRSGQFVESASTRGAVWMTVTLPTVTSLADEGYLAEAIRVVFERWGLNGAQQLRLLGLNAESRSSLRKLQFEPPSLPGGIDTQARVRLLLDIFNQVEDTWGGTPLADLWLSTPNKAFNDKSPLEYIGTDFLRLARVQQYLQQGA